ncbi:MAG TPA: S8/S53 family peptidase [Actinomycetota bacterium]|nr:S8/S53 family peptidase [Actinomycetota bacterium]
MRKVGAIACLLIVAALLPAAPGRAAKRAASEGGARDAVVVAVIDFRFSPYHWDYLADKMPQHLDGDRGNDLPLDRPPHEWLPGAPSPGAFASYNRTELSLEKKDPSADLAALGAKDSEKWSAIQQSTDEGLHYYWFPGTKVIGALDFGGRKIHGTSSDHGMGTSSVSVGNLHGTCPECLLVFIDINGATDGERAIEWAMNQPWIDVITNSYGFSTAVRDRIYAGSDTDLQRRASVRGQTIFFSAGNGNDGAFIVPNTTSFSSQEGPDWIVTVGAVSPGNHASYSGHGRPADIAGIGSDYPSSYTARTVSETGQTGFGGTSNATPTIAGLYARALYEARASLDGRSRIQRRGVVATGKPFRCAGARPKCELGDGKLTVTELRRRLFHGAVHTPAGLTPGPLGVGQLPPVGEDEFVSEGHGSYFAREEGNPWLEEFDRILAPMQGRAEALERPEGEREWMIVDSYCRQHLWGSWGDGYYVEGKTELPGPDPQWPLRSAIEEGCPLLPSQRDEGP